MPRLLLLASAVVRPDPGTSRTWVQDELRKPEYHQQSLLERLLAVLGRFWALVTDQASRAGAFSAPIAVVLLLLVVGLGVFVVSRIRREPAGGPIPGPVRGTVLGMQQASPDALRARALRALEEGRADDAMVDAVRAVAARMVQRGLLEDLPGLTAHEIAISIGPAFPPHATDLTRAAELFDLVFYGHGQAREVDARSVLTLEDELRRTRPQVLGAERASAGLVPG
jgi:Domain of unknown function (DUF4129)